MESVNDENVSFFTFGQEIDSINYSSGIKPGFSEPLTQLDDITGKIFNYKSEISSALIISDGIYNSGVNPVTGSDKINIPVFTVGIGDTNKQKDIEIRQVLSNQYVYAGKETEIKAILLNSGYEGLQKTVNLYEGNRVVDSKNVTLSESGITETTFIFKPESAGEKRMIVSASPVENEKNTENNRKLFFLDVLESKTNVLVLSGSPSPDVSQVIKTLKRDENLSVKSIIQIAKNKFLEDPEEFNLLDSADILFFIGFPSQNTPSTLMNKVETAVLEESIPVFFTLSEGTDFNKLSTFGSVLPFEYTSVREGKYNSIQPEITEEISPLFENNAAEPILEWNKLTPVLRTDGIYSPKPGSKVLTVTKIKGVVTDEPMLLTKSTGSRRSIALLAKDYWKWQMRSAQKENNLFDSFLANSVKWLSNIDNKKQVQLSTNKKVYAAGEEVEITAQVYDETLEPVDNAEVEIRTSGNNDERTIYLKNTGNGLYEGTFSSLQAGNYTINAEAGISGNILGTDNTNFSIGEVNIELADLTANSVLLKQLASLTNGEYYYIDDAIDVLPRKLSELRKQGITNVTSTSKYSLWNEEILLIVIIIMFSLEWFIRKRTGML